MSLRAIRNHTGRPEALGWRVKMAEVARDASLLVVGDAWAVDSRAECFLVAERAILQWAVKKAGTSWN